MSSAEEKAEVIIPITRQDIEGLYSEDPMKGITQIDAVIKETDLEGKLNTLKSQKKELFKTLEKCRAQYAKGLISLEQIISQELEGAAILDKLNSNIQLGEATLERSNWAKRILKQRCRQKGIFR